MLKQVSLNISKWSSSIKIVSVFYFATLSSVPFGGIPLVFVMIAAFVLYRKMEKKGKAEEFSIVASHYYAIASLSFKFLLLSFCFLVILLSLQYSVLVPEEVRTVVIQMTFGLIAFFFIIVIVNWVRLFLGNSPYTSFVKFITHVLLLPFWPVKFLFRFVFACLRKPVSIKD